MHFRIHDLEEKNNVSHFKTQTCQPKSENLRLLASNVGVSSRPSRGHPLLCTEYINMEFQYIGYFSHKQNCNPILSELY